MSESTQHSKVALVTGGSRGLGRALTAALAERGWLVVIDGRDATTLVATASELGAAVTAVVGDVADPVHRADLVRTADGLGTLTLVVNNAGSLGPSPLPVMADVALPAVRQVFEANVLAPLALVQDVIGILRRHGGTIVNVTSDAAVEGYEGWGAYGLSKAALESVTRVLAAEEPLVRVLAVDPGDLRTEMHQAAFPGEDISDRPLPESVAPAIVELIESIATSGRYRAPELVR
jgi:NAD(P)-dependent dehydrogenase (short-subunit alcohol dehydrogenase family)